MTNYILQIGERFLEEWNGRYLNLMHCNNIVLCKIHTIYLYLQNKKYQMYKLQFLGFPQLELRVLYSGSHYFRQPSDSNHFDCNKW